MSGDPLDLIREFAARMVERANVEAVIRDAAMLDRGVIVRLDADGHVTDAISSPYIPADTAYVAQMPEWLQ